MAQAILSSLCSPGYHPILGYPPTLLAQDLDFKHALPYSTSAENVYELNNASVSVIRVVHSPEDSIYCVTVSLCTYSENTYCENTVLFVWVCNLHNTEEVQTDPWDLVAS